MLIGRNYDVQKLLSVIWRIISHHDLCKNHSIFFLIRKRLFLWMITLIMSVKESVLSVSCSKIVAQIAHKVKLVWWFFFLILSTCIQSVNGFLVCKGTVVLRWWESETKTGFPREHRKPQNSRTKTHFSSGYNLSTCNQWTPLIPQIY